MGQTQIFAGIEPREHQRAATVMRIAPSLSSCLPPPPRYAWSPSPAPGVKSRGVRGGKGGGGRHPHPLCGGGGPRESAVVGARPITIHSQSLIHERLLDHVIA